MAEGFGMNGKRVVYEHGCEIGGREFFQMFDVPGYLATPVIECQYCGDKIPMCEIYDGREMVFLLRNNGHV